MDLQVLRAFVVFVAIVTAVDAYRMFVSIPATYQLSDWLLSYAGGFVRRGLGGEVVYTVADVSGASPRTVVLLLQLSGYAALFLGVYRLAVRLRPIPPYLWPVIFSPWLLAFQVENAFAAYRKDALALGLLAMVGVLVARGDGEDASGAVAWATVLFVPLVLIHELTIVLLPYLLLLGKRATWSPRRKAILAVGLMGTVLAAVAAAVRHGTTEQATAICEQMIAAVAITPTVGDCLRAGAAAWLTVDAPSGARMVWREFQDPGLALAVAVLALLAGAALIPAIVQLRRSASAATWRTFVVGTSLALGMCLPVLVVALDWTRFIHLQAAGNAITLLALLGRIGASPPPRNRRVAWSMVAITVACALAWHVADDVALRISLPGP